MIDNILESVKPLTNIEPDDRSFDEDILIYINSTITTLYQMGVESDLYSIDEDTDWTDYLPEGHVLNMVKDYVSKKVRLKFDPPTGSALDALEQVIKELEWRINVEVDPKTEE